MFHSEVAVTQKGHTSTMRVINMVETIQHAKYPAISKEEEVDLLTLSLTFPLIDQLTGSL